MLLKRSFVGSGAEGHLTENDKEPPQKGGSKLKEKPQQWQWITFEIAGTRYCHPIADIEEIFHYTAPTPVPGSPSGIEGILNIRGSIATIYSGRTLFESEPAEPNDDWRIITLAFDQNFIGMIVDRVDEIIHFDPEKIEHTHEVSDQRTLVKGTIYAQERLYSVLDFYRLVDFDDE